METALIRFHSSLQKLSAHNAPQVPPAKELFGLWGETVSFQISCRFTPECSGELFARLSVECPGCSVSVFEEGFVPCTYPCAPDASGPYLTRTPCLMPDPLYPSDGGLLRLTEHLSRIFWVDVTIPRGAVSCSVRAALFSRSGALLGEALLPLTVVPCPLPAPAVRHSQWFYCDCLCHAYGCAMFSDEFFTIAGRYLRCAAEHGIDTLLTPVFTPSLDIEPGGRRMPGQLVRVSRADGAFRFDFSLLERWVRLALECGLRFFEIVPFFTQWGARCAVEIYEDTPAGPRTLFGWDTPALSDSYGDFLAQFLPALLRELERLGVREHTFFHISDEPSPEHLEHYRAARERIVPYLEGCPVIDALSSFEFYQNGLVSIPVVAEDHLDPFLQGPRRGPLWTYSCCIQDKLVPNVFLSMPSLRARILGTLLYVFQLDGFLRWGYNFWNSQLSRAPIDPYRITDAGMGFPSGDGFLVYPGPGGQPVPSIRLKLLRDAFQDQRALSALEARVGRHAVLSLIQEHLGPVSFSDYPTDEQRFLAFRRAISQRLLDTLC